MAYTMDIMGTKNVNPYGKHNNYIPLNIVFHPTTVF